MKLEMAKFLQDTIEDSAVKRKGAKGDTVREFVQFMDKVRVSSVTWSDSRTRYL